MIQAAEMHFSKPTCVPHQDESCPFVERIGVTTEPSGPEDAITRTGLYTKPIGKVASNIRFPRKEMICIRHESKY